MQIRKNIYIKGTSYLISISITTFILYYILWWITDKKVLFNDGFSLRILLRDYGYCLLLTSLTLFVCHIVTAIRFFRKRNITRIVFLIFVIFGFSLAIAQGVAILWNFNTPVPYTILLLDIYFLSILSTFVSSIFISKYYCDIVTHNSHEKNRLRMKLLKRQLDPHFMFNSLNTIAELIHENPSLAEDFTIRLSNVYRYIIMKYNDDVVTIHDAIYVTHEYCKLLESRYPHNFLITFDPQIDISQDKIPPLSMQQLVENAIKHNRHSATNPLEITFTIDDHYITVRNNLAPILDRSIPSNGIGLKNLKDRYHYFCSLPMIINKTDSYFEVKLPIIKDYENTDN